MCGGTAHPLAWSHLAGGAFLYSGKYNLVLRAWPAAQSDELLHSRAKQKRFEENLNFCW